MKSPSPLPKNSPKGPPMQRRTSRNLRRAPILAVILAVTPRSGSPDLRSPGSGVVQTAWGPLTPGTSDHRQGPPRRAVGDAHRSAGPTAGHQPRSRRSVQRSPPSTPSSTRSPHDCRQAGRAAAEPRYPSKSNWMKEISVQDRVDYDRTAVQRLREAHGMVLPVLAQVNAGTHNEPSAPSPIEGDALRQPAHNTLRAPDRVDYTALPESPSPGCSRGRRTGGT